MHGSEMKLLYDKSYIEACTGIRSLISFVKKNKDGRCDSAVIMKKNLVTDFFDLD